MLPDIVTESDIAATQKEETLRVGNQSHPVPRVPGRHPRLRPDNPRRNHLMGDSNRLLPLLAANRDSSRHLHPIAPRPARTHPQEHSQGLDPPRRRRRRPRPTTPKRPTRLQLPRPPVPNPPSLSHRHSPSYSLALRRSRRPGHSRILRSAVIRRCPPKAVATIRRSAGSG